MSYLCKRHAEISLEIYRFTFYLSVELHMVFDHEVAIFRQIDSGWLRFDYDHQSAVTGTISLIDIDDLPDEGLLSVHDSSLDIYK
ncbi:hypothetical protein L1887_09079 [Cichorium endivia]|nr:hypothetical protein L1887_09079 [Cichorium endivia]